MQGIFFEKLPDIIIGFIIPIIIYFFKRTVWDKIQNHIFVKNTAFNLTGIWYADHNVFYDSLVHIIEILTIKQNSSELILKIEQYRTDKKNIPIFIGKGIIKAGVICLYYVSNQVVSKQSGVMTLEVKDINSINTYLSGCYYEICEGKEKHNFTNYPADFYKAYRLELTKKHRIRSFFRLNLFRDYSDAKSFINKGIKEHA